MSTTVNAERYEDLVRRSGLVDAAHLDNVMGELTTEHGGRPLDSAILAQKLLDRQLITTWQNEKLMQGRHKGFFLCQYKLLHHLSKGGMSEVYAAEDTTTRQKVAIKVFPPALIEQSSYLARFQQEARTQQSLDHPNIVRATDFGCAGKIHYLVMEFVNGVDLHRLVEQRGPLPFRDAAGYIVQAAEALEYAHGRHMVHRDIKPGNLMLDQKGVVKLLDLGLARILSEEGSLTIKHNENSLGTADYVAPEQAVDSHGVDERADVYSLGGTLYYLLMGHPPFPEGTPVQRMMAHMKDQPADVRTKRPEAPAGLLEVMAKMMAKRPDDRYRTMADVRDAVQAWLDSPEGLAITAADEPSSSVRTFGVAPGAKLDANARQAAGGSAPASDKKNVGTKPAAAAPPGSAPKNPAPGSNAAAAKTSDRPPAESGPNASTVAGVPAPGSIPNRGKADAANARPAPAAPAEPPGSAARASGRASAAPKNPPGSKSLSASVGPSPTASSASPVLDTPIPATPMEPVETALPAFLNDSGASSMSRSSERSVSLSRSLKKPDPPPDGDSLLAIGGEVGYALGIGLVAAMCGAMALLPWYIVGLGVGALFAGGRLVFSSLTPRR